MPQTLFKLSSTFLSPIIKWAGGKEKELKYILSSLPSSFENYYEPFVGGGAIYTSMEAKHLFVNDKSGELMALYQSISSQNNDFFYWLECVVETWNSALEYNCELEILVKYYIDHRAAIQRNALEQMAKAFIDVRKETLSAILDARFVWNTEFFLEIFEETLCRKILRMQELEQEKGNLPDADVKDNILTALMGSVYMYFRKLYNDRSLMSSNRELHTAIFVFIRNYAYSGMFRYSKSGEFNVPYGGIGYNKKSLAKKIQYYKSADLLQHMSKTTFSCADFMDFFNIYTPQADDFVFLDPPYDSEFSTYAQNEFNQQDQQRLSDFLCNQCRAKWLLIIKNTPFIFSLYDRKGLFISSFDKTYQVSFMNRNNRNAEHLLISNYPR